MCVRYSVTCSLFCNIILTFRNEESKSPRPHLTRLCSGALQRIRESAIVEKHRSQNLGRPIRDVMKLKRWLS